MRSTTGSGIAALLDGRIDIALAMRLPTAAERTQAETVGMRLHMTTVAYDALAVIVHPSVAVESVTLSQLKQIFFEGTTMDWSTPTGGTKRGRIRVYHPDVAISAVAGQFNLTTAGRRNAVHASGSVQVYPPSNVVTSVAEDPNAIGYASLRWVSSKIRVLAVEEVGPNERTVLDGSYPFGFPLFFVTDGVPTGLARELVSLLQSTASQQSIVREAGFIPAY